MTKKKLSSVLVFWAVAALVVFGASILLIYKGKELEVRFARAAYAITLSANSDGGEQAELERLPAAGETGPHGVGETITQLWAGLVKELAAERVVLEAPEFLVTLPGSEPMMADLPSRVIKALLTNIHRLDIGALRLERGTVRVRLQTASGAEVASDAFVLNNVNASFEIGGPKAGFSGSGAFLLGDQENRFEIDLGALQQSSSGGSERAEAAFSLKNATMSMEFGGFVSPDSGITAIGKFAFDAPQLAAFMDWLGYTLPAVHAPGAVWAKGNLNIGHAMVSLDDSSFGLDGNSLNGAVALELGGERPRADATLALESLDLSPYLRGASSEGKDVDPWAGLRKLATNELQGPALKAFDADLRVSANDMKIGAIRIGGAALTLSLRSGKLLADVAEASVAGGLLRGQVELDTGTLPARLLIRGEIRDAAIETCLFQLFPARPVIGRATVAVDLEAHGKTLNELVRGLGGGIRVHMPEGGRLGTDLGSLYEKAKSGPIDGWARTRVGSASFQSLTTRLELSAGLISIHDLKIHSGARIFAATGQLEIPRGHMNIRLQPADPPVEENGQTQGTPQPDAEFVVFKGRWDSPRIEFHAERAADKRGLPAATPDGEAERDNSG